MDDGAISERDFAMIRELGFDYARIPLSYLFFGKGAYGREVDESRLWLTDRAVQYGRDQGVHVTLAFHRAPGYCVTQDTACDFPERGDLFHDDADLADFVRWWRTIAERYWAAPPAELSFNPVNEPGDIGDADFDRVFRPVTDAIWEANPSRLIHLEGRFAGGADSLKFVPPTALLAQHPKVVNSAHMYRPVSLTHFGCPWHTLDGFAAPSSWPYRAEPRPGAAGSPTGDEARLWDKEALRDALSPWLDLTRAGHAVHVGELGAYSKVAHEVYLAYLSDLLDVLAEHGLGWAMWNFRGPFGVLDTGRTDVDYAWFHGHALDKELLAVLRSH
jgi:endoglucanase